MRVEQNPSTIRTRRFVNKRMSEDPEKFRAERARLAREGRARRKAEDPEGYRDKERAAQKKWADKNPEKVRATSRRSYKKNVDSHRRSWIKRRYKITLEEYRNRFEACGGRCGMCQEPIILFGGRIKGAQLDHNHETKKIREFLCASCNRGLGSFHESKAKLAKAIDYITKHEK